MKITTIIPTIPERKKMLKEAVESWKMQVYSDKELIVVEDIDKKGVSWACNRGIEKASGEIINILHDDDKYYNEDVLFNIFWKFNFNECDFLWTGYKEFCRTDKEIKAKCITTSDIWKEDIVNLCSIFWMKSIHNKIGYFDERLLSNEDWHFKIRLFMECIGKSFNIISVYYRRHRGNKVLLNAGKLKHYEKIMREDLKERYKHLFDGDMI